MFKNVLVPVVDDMVTAKNLKVVADLIKADGAGVILTYISDPRAPFVYADKVSDYQISDANHKKACKNHAKRVLDKALKLLGKDIKAKIHHEFNASVYEGILAVAKKSNVDAIIMASHKRTGIKDIFIASDTHAVIAHSKIPVLVV